MKIECLPRAAAVGTLWSAAAALVIARIRDNRTQRDAPGQLATVLSTNPTG